ncbi:MAG TPA: photosynthetic reaction center cytochrome c subunit family protein [Bryobacteraceae bacterium]|nr:photosynthetic reaction center cytochrome c subunit family protein [Bryobacteraceae bacterium]
MKYSLNKLMQRGAVAMLAAAVPFGGVAFAQAKPQMADDVFKNIQVLKGLTVDEFMGTMGLFSAALNVCCGDCHVGAGGSNPQWEKDVPRKITARRMIQVMNNVNKTNFGGAQVVTCWTCHRGTSSPATTPGIDAIYSDPVPQYTDVLPQAPATAVVPTVDQLVDSYIKALGGADAVAKVTSYVGKGTSTTFGADQLNPAEIYAKAPDKFVTIVHQREGNMIRTYDGRDAWVALPLTVVEEYQLTASAAEGGKLDGQMAFPGNIKQFFKTWRVSFTENIDGPPLVGKGPNGSHMVNVLQGSDSGGLIATFYFDKESGLLRRMVRYSKSAVGRVPTQIDYSDYRPVSGVMMPFKRTFGWVSGREEYTLTDIQANVPVDDAKFAKPPAPAPPAK